MTVYWIDPHATVNGTGTYASPYSFNSSTRTAFVSGDELRIKGVALSSLLTATTYTATYTSNYQLTITAGGGLGADFAANNIIYLPDVGTFCKITSVAGNVIAVSSSSILPWYNTSTGQTTITVRKVDTTTYPASSTTTSMYLAATPSISNMTITDCWIDPTTRVTDGTVKTLIHSSNTVSSNANFYIDGNASTSTRGTNRNYDLANTHILGTNVNGNYIFMNFYGSNVTATIGQCCGSGLTSGGFAIGGSGAFSCQNVSITVTHYNSMGLVSSIYGNNISITVSNASSYYIDWFITGSSQTALAKPFSNITINIGNWAIYTNASANVVFIYSGSYVDVTINFNGAVDYYSNNSLSAFNGGYGNLAVNFGAGFQFRYNRRASTQTSIGALTRFAGNYTYEKYYVPNIPTPSGWTASTPVDLSTVYANPTGSFKSIPLTSSINIHGNINTAYRPVASFNGGLANTVLTFRDGTAPVEHLGVASPNTANTSIPLNAFPIVSTDASVYLTTGPSLKSNLATRSTTYWQSVSESKSTKAIKVPVTAGVSTTVSGYIRNNITGYANGDCKMRVMFNETELGFQSMTTASNSAWEQFTITFTPTYTGEATLCWEMYYANAGSYWLDDLTIT